MVSLRKREKQRVALHGNCCHAFLQGRQCTVDCRVLDHNFISNLFGSFLVWMKNLGRFLFLSLVLSPLKKWFIPKWVRSENSSVFTHACMLGNLKVVRLDISYISNFHLPSEIVVFWFSYVRTCRSHRSHNMKWRATKWSYARTIKWAIPLVRTYVHATCFNG